MTTSRGPSARMFSLHRRQSALNLPSLGSGAADSTASTSNSSADASIVRSVQSPLTSSSLIGEDQEEGEVQDQEPSPTCRQSSKDKASKGRPQKDPAIPIRSSTGRNVVTTKSPTPAAELTRSTQARDPECIHQRPEPKPGHRSLHSNPTGHERTLSRDFVLPTIPTSSVRHENCSSLKDQFLKIKERFSPSSPPRSSTATASVSPLTVVTPPSFSSATATASTRATSTETSDRVTEAVGLQTESTATLGEQHERQEQSADDSSWELPQARVERWYREDDFFKACITCWTMEAGAAIVSRVAHVVSEWPAGNSSRSSTSGRGASASGSNSIHPDVSLQWIGRQLWAVTVSLPLTRSGELREEHIALAHRINQAVAEVSKRSEALAVLPDATGVADEAQHLQATLSIAMHQETDAVPASGSDEKKASTELQSLPSAEFGRDSGVDASQEPVATHNSSPFSTLAAEEVEASRLLQPQSAGGECVDGEEDATSDNPEGEAKRQVAEKDQDAQDDQDDQDEDDGDRRVAALPLSWSMLSLSSQPSGSSEHASTSLHGEFPITDDDSASDPATNIAPEKTGWLKKKKRKQHGLGSSWQQRYFELKGNRLYYFASEADGLPRGAVLLDHALVQRGSGDHAMAFSISSASSHRRLQILKFSARLTHHVYPRKSIELRVMEETDSAVIDWVAALNRASFYCKLASASAGCSATLPAPSSSSSFGPFSTPDRRRKTPFYRFRSPSATKAALATASQSLSAEKERRDVEITEAEELWTTTARWTASYQQLGSVQYLRETDPLLWEVHPPEQIAIRKKAARARTRSDYLAIFTRHAGTFAQIFLPRPQPISLEQTLRDILPELFLINDTLYGGGEQQQQQPQQATEQGQSDSSQQQSRGLEHIFEVLDAHIQRFAAAPEERVRAVSALLQACARTISGGDSYFVVHRLLGNPNLIIRPAEARGRPIEIDVSPDRPSHFLITVFSAFSFHHVDDVERFGDSSDANGGGMTPAPLLRVRTRHIQEFDFASGTSSRWLRVHMEGRKEDSGSKSGGGAGGGSLGRWGSRRQSHEVAESRIGALLDALS